MAERRAQPNVFNIPAGLPFLEVLADAILSGALTGEPVDPADPLALSRITLFLPTRRAARALRDEFLRRGPKSALLLPRIRPIGEVDEAEVLMDGGIDPAMGGAEALALPPAIPAFERRLALTRLAMAWRGATGQTGEPDGTGHIRPIPANPADAAHLAAELEAVMDAVANEEVGYSGLDTLVPEDYARMWQLTLDFLGIVSRQWPAYLAERGAMDGMDRRNRLIRAEARRLAGLDRPGPVIAAGSTGSLPATAELLKTIARLPRGALVLPGLDTSLDEESWQAIGRQAEPRSLRQPGKTAPSHPGHPQYGLKHLIETVGIDRDEIADLAPSPEPVAARREILSEALRPAATTEAWPAFRAATPEGRIAQALDGLSTLAADSETEEALAIALALREHLQTGTGTAALVTPDRNLARRVAAELRRWSIHVDDSAGRPLSRTVPGGLALEAAAAAFDAWSATGLLALVKHPLVRLGRTPGAVRRSARRLELALLRGPRLDIRLADLPRHLAEARENATTERPRRSQKLLGPADWDAAEKLAADLVDALGPLLALTEEAGRGPLAVNRLAEALTGAVTALADPGVESGETNGAFTGPAGRGLDTFLRSLAAADAAGLAIKTAEFPDLLAALMASTVVDPAIPGDERIRILGTLEARLISADLTILGGLNEGVWPGDTRLDPWLSRPMREGLGLPAPERRIGLSAHDFTTLAAAPKVMITRAARAGGSPTVASRWLMRLEALIGEDHAETLAARTDYLKQWARCLDARPDPGARPAKRPDPKPPVAVRPVRLPVTAIETWIRDPYAIYARHILKLNPLEGIGEEPDMAERGSLVHDILEAYALERRARPDRPPLDLLLEIGERRFARWRDYPDIAISWWPRFRRAARWFADWETGWLAAVAETFVEIEAEVDLKVPGARFTLNGRADRIDRLADGRLAILDYKTGGTPSASQIRAGLAPQLPLEAMLARDGHFKGIPAAPLGPAGYIRLTGQHPPGEEELLPVKDDISAIADMVTDSLKRMIAAYADPSQIYLSRARPLREAAMDGPYDHLARTREWSLGGEDET